LFVHFSTEFTTYLEGQRLEEPCCNFEDTMEIKAYMESIEKSFLLQIQSLIDCIQILGVAETARLNSLVSQLDYNNYYAYLMPTPEFVMNPIVPPSR
jgi:hypothetical protein